MLKRKGQHQSPGAQPVLCRGIGGRAMKREKEILKPWCVGGGGEERSDGSVEKADAILVRLG